MNITSITARFKRSRQPAPYETAEAEVDLVATLDEGESAEGKAESLLDQCAAAVYARLGMADPKIDEKPKVEKPATGRGRPKKAEAPKKSAADIDDVDETPTSDQITDKDIQDACASQARVVGAAAVKALFTDFGVARSAEIPQDQRAKFLEDLKALEAGNK